MPTNSYRAVVVSLAIASVNMVVTVAAGDDKPADFFTARVAPILTQHCVGCHGPETQEGELRLDSRDGLDRGGQSGAVIIPGSPDESLLIAAIRRTDESLRMPPETALSQAEIDAVTTWIADGADHPEGRLIARPLAPPFDVDAARQFWAFQPIPVLPRAASDLDAANEIDRLIAERLSERGMSMNPRADKHTLLRRATIALTGLPPTSADLADFLADDSEQSFERVVDRLLASPAYGQRWGRHWLDVVRYADSNGLDENIAHGNAWRYRNYVIDSFNADKPWDRFLTEQIAGDLLNDPDTPESLRNERLTATGFLLLGPKVLAEGDETRMQMDIIDEQLDTIGRSMLGLTFGCARCHDHKFDPLSQADYYAMAGIFQSTRSMESYKRIARWNENSIATAADRDLVAAHAASIAAKQMEIDELLKSASAATAQTASLEPRPEASAEDQLPTEVRERLAGLRAELKALEAAAPELPTAMGVIEGELTDARILPRGSHLTPGRTVSRGVPVVLRPEAGLTIANGASGRLEFARWIASDSNPLTARVIVNRVWRWHFGRGLVASPDNFGVQGERPTHPELLDFLASEFVQSGWSLKSLHRRLLLSQTWQQSSDASPSSLTADPDNALVSRWSLRRLDAETLRDSLLAVSGQLDVSAGQSLLHVKNREFLFDHTSKDGTTYASMKRSVYLPVIRNNLYDAMSLFDCTDGTVPNGDRASSTVASQALFLLNSDLVIDAASRIAAPIVSAESTDAARADRLFAAVLQREPSDQERADLLEAVQRLSGQPESSAGPDSQSAATVWAAVCQSLLMSNEFLYVR